MQKTNWIGAHLDKERAGVNFRIWAPLLNSLSVVLNPDSDQSEEIEMAPVGGGYFEAFVSDLKAGARYKYKLDGKDLLPDPISRFQPEGPLGPSEVVDDEFNWQVKDFKGYSLKEMVLYELHIGTFTSAGTFDSAIDELDRLATLGINTIEVLPISQFSGSRNWGYDGTYPHAVQNTYGGPSAFKSFIDACHQRNIAVVLDAVYNHLGPEGNFIPRYLPVFQDKYHTPWGQAINFDGPGSDGVKEFFLQSVRQWLVEYKIDGMRLDAIQTIFDTSPYPFLEQLTDLKRSIETETGRQIQIIGETDMNDPRVIKPPEKGGLGLDSHWNDDFHHVLHGLLSGDRQGYFGDYHGAQDIKKLYQNRVVYDGQHSAFRKRSHGRSYDGIAPERLMVCNQNHDQVGNRALGDRKTTYLDLEGVKLAGAAILLSPFLPMLFMGEEYGEKAPFQYFVSHESSELNQAVREGRSREFEEFEWQGDIPDPVSEKTFQQSKLDTTQAMSRKGVLLQRFYKDLIAISKAIRNEGWMSPENIQVHCDQSREILQVQGSKGFNLLFNFSERDASLDPVAEVSEILIDSSLYVEGLNEQDINYGSRQSEMTSDRFVLKGHSAIAFRG